MPRDIAVLVDLYWASPGIAAPCLRNWAYRNADLKDRVDIRILASSVERSPSEISDEIQALRPKAVGFSCYVWNIAEIGCIVPLLKARCPEAKVILGGPEAAPIPQEILRRIQGVDFVAYADEGEEVFRLFLRALALGEGAIEDTPGVAFQSAAAVRKTPVPPFIDLDAAPLLYAAGGWMPSPLGTNLETSRGCSFTCKYCDWGDRRMRYVSIHRIEKEFGALAAITGSVGLTDADILMNRKRGAAVLEAFLESTRGSRIKLHFNTNPTFLHRDIVDILARAPEKFVLYLGVQSTNPRALELIERPFDRAKVEANLGYFLSRAPGVGAAIQLIFGLPGDDLEGYRKSLDWGLGMLAPHKTGPFLETGPLLLLPGAAVYREAEALGLLRHSLKPPYQVERTAMMPEMDMQRAFDLAGHALILSSWPECRALLLPLAAEAPQDRELPYVRLLEEWIEYLKAKDVPLMGSSAHFDVEAARRRLAQDPGLGAAVLLASRRFADERALIGTSVIKS